MLRDVGVQPDGHPLLYGLLLLPARAAPAFNPITFDLYCRPGVGENFFAPLRIVRVSRYPSMDCNFFPVPDLDLPEGQVSGKNAVPLHSSYLISGLVGPDHVLLAVAF